jgi:tetratricopeptide (TPR) repeat protein
MANEKLIVELTAQIQGLKSGLDSASAQLTKFNDKTTNTGKNAEKDFDAIGSAASKVGGIVAGAFAIGSVVSFGQGIIAATSEFQKFEAVLSNTLGSSSAAQLALSQIQQFAATTPFQINELTGAFVKLANQGFTPNIAQMRLLGDLASSTGKSFDQLAEAILDAQTGEFERLKEFGVRAAVAGDQVTFTFKGIKTQVDNTSEAIRGYVLSLGAAEGVSGSMEKISGTLGGRISNVKDSFTQLQTTIGSINSGVLFSFVGYLQQALGYFNEIINLDLKRVQFAMEGLNMTEQRAVIKEYNAQLSKIGSTDNIGKLNQQLKFIQTNLEFYQQAMLNETDEHNRDIAFSYFNAYKDLRNNANTQMAGLQKDLAAKNAALAAEAKKTKRVIGETIDFIAPAIGIKPIPNAPVSLGGLKESNVEANQAAYDKEQENIRKTNALLEQGNTILGYQTLLVNTLQSGFEQMFSTIIDGGQNPFQGLLNGLKQLMIKLAAAIAAAAILFVLSGGLSSGGNALQKIGEIAKTMGGLGFNPFTLGSGGGGKSAMIAMPSSSTGQGGYQVDIMGDKMRLLLDNQAIKNSRVV